MPDDIIESVKPETTENVSQQDSVETPNTGGLQSAEDDLLRALGIEKPTPEENTDTQEPEKAESDSEIDELKNPNRENWRKLDKIARERKAKLRELEAKVADFEEKAKVSQQQATPKPSPEVSTQPVQQAPVQPEATKPLPKKEEPQYQPHDVIGLLARIESGDFVEQFQGQGQILKQQAVEYLSESLTPDQVKKVMLDSTRGGYGPHSEAMAKLAREYLPVVLATHDEKQRVKNAESQVQVQRNESWNKVFKQFPALQSQDKNSVDYKEYTTANEVISSVFPEIWKRPDAPTVIADFMQLRRQALSAIEHSKTVDTLRKENEALKKRLGMSERPQAPNRETVHGQGKKSTAEEILRQQFSEIGIGQ